MAINRKLYVIRHDSDDWTPIVAVISGPKSPALSTMMKRFDAMIESPDVPKINTMEDYERWRDQYCASQERITAAGFKSYGEYFIDWLLKTDSRFERVEFSEVSL